MKRKKTLAIIVTLIIFALISVFWITVDGPDNPANYNEIQQTRYNLERAYFQGQKDAIENNLKIKKNDKGIYEWTKNPYTLKPLYVPTK